MKANKRMLYRLLRRDEERGTPVKKFTISYELLTEDSLKRNDVEDRGRVSTTDCLRLAIEDLTGCALPIIGAWPNDNEDPRWVTVCYDWDDYGEQEVRDIYFRIKDGPTLSSRRRISNYICSKF